MLGLVKVAVGNVGKVLETCHREEIVPVRGFPDVNQSGQLLAMVPQITGADLEATGRGVMRVAGDAECVLTADRSQDLLRWLVGADVLLDVQRDDVRVLLRPDTVLRHLRARDHEHPVLVPGTCRLRLDVLEIGVEITLLYAERTASQRRQPAGAREDVLLHQDVVGDGDDVELAGATVQVDHFTD